MSNRAIARLRQERDGLLSPDVVDEEDEDESSDEEEEVKKPGFAFMMDDDDDESSSSSSSSDRGDDAIEEGPNKTTPTASTRAAAGSGATEDDDEEDEEQDLDALLEEFKVQDEFGPVDDVGVDEKTSSYYDIVTSNIELRGLDIDFVMRTSLLGSNEDSAPVRNRRGRSQVFGPARDNWPRPPHYVGGGMGMVTYETAKQQPPAIPWPYSEMKDGDERCPESQRWFLFTYSDSYQRDREDLERIKASGDPNALALFIAHHPFVVEALLQLSTVLYQTNQSQEGLSLLKRALYTYECAALNSFLQVEERLGFMDHEQPINELFFVALFRLVRVSHIAG
jgi:hypothetical protein